MALLVVQEGLVLNRHLLFGRFDQGTASLAEVVAPGDEVANRLP